MKRLDLLLALLLLPALAQAQDRAEAQDPPLAEAGALGRRLLEDLPQRAVVVGLIDARGRRWVRGFGHVPGAERAPRGDDVFEIGSLTKAFTGALLADAAARGEVALEDDPWRHLPPRARPPQGSPAQGVTLLHLTTHRSGLPRLPPNLVIRAPRDPFAGYDEELLYACTAALELDRAPGAAYEYSNLGAGLLGHVLVRAAEAEDYEALVRERLCRPLGLADTRVSLEGPFGERLVQGWTQFGQPQPPWALGSLVAAGGLRSTVDDLLTLAQALLAAPDDAADPAARARRALRAAAAPRAEAGGGMRIGLGWHLRGDVVWHNGATGGYCSFFGVDRARGVAAVILANGAIAGQVTPAGFELVDLLAAE